MHRPKYLNQTLLSLSKLPGLHRLAVYVSQDGNHTGVEQVVQAFAQDVLAPPTTRSFTHWQRDRVPQLGPKQVPALCLRTCSPTVGTTCDHALGLLAFPQPTPCCETCAEAACQSLSP